MSLFDKPWLTSSNTSQRSGQGSPRLSKPDFYPHFTIGFCETASEAYAVFDCFTIPSVATGLTSHFKKMWVKDGLSKRGRTARRRSGEMFDTFSQTCYTQDMKQTMLLKLAPTPEQAQALLDTMHTFNAACDYIADRHLRPRLPISSSCRK